ncbi:MAG TPA: Gfo/Idh/MocA family oxidoreductase [Hyphomicrobiaceae bacterium]|jgi:predicted dehydrogenase
MKRRRIALIGLGMAVTPHAKSLLDLGDRAEVAFAMSPSAGRRQAFAARFPFPISDSVAAVAADASIDAVAILTPPNTHLEIATGLAKAGKHILLEKPLEVATERAEALVAACRDAGVTLGVVLQHRFKPAAERLAAILRDGELGEVVNCSTSIRLWRPQSYYDEPGRGTRARDGGGVLMTQGIHTLDLMLSLAGPVVEVAGFARTTPVHRMETEDLVCAAVRFASGAVGVIDATTAAYPGSPERIELIGTKGTAALAGTELIVRFHDGRHEEVAADASPGGTGADPMAFPHDYHLAVWRDFLDAIDSGRPPRISGAEALAVHRLIDALLAAGTTGRSVMVRGMVR